MLCVCCSYSSRAQPGPWRDKASSPCARRARARPLEGPSPKLLRLSRHRPSGQGPYSTRLSRSKRRLEERKGEAGKWTRVAARAGDGARERVREDGGWLTGADERWREGTDILCALLGSLWTRDAECEGQREGAMSWETATTTRGRSGGGGEGAHLVAKDVGRHGAQAGPSRGGRGGERAARRPLSLSRLDLSLSASLCSASLCSLDTRQASPMAMMDDPRWLPLERCVPASSSSPSSPPLVQLAHPRLATQQPRQLQPMECIPRPRHVQPQRLPLHRRLGPRPRAPRLRQAARKGRPHALPRHQGVRGHAQDAGRPHPQGRRRGRRGRHLLQADESRRPFAPPCAHRGCSD